MVEKVSVRRSAFVEVAMEHAIFPHRAESNSRRLGGPGAKMTVEDVARRLGPEAAAAWQALREAKAAFIRSVT